MIIYNDNLYYFFIQKLEYKINKIDLKVIQ